MPSRQLSELVRPDISRYLRGYVLRRGRSLCGFGIAWGGYIPNWCDICTVVFFCCGNLKDFERPPAVFPTRLHGTQARAQYAIRVTVSTYRSTISIKYSCVKPER